MNMLSFFQKCIATIFIVYAAMFVSISWHLVTMADGMKEGHHCMFAFDSVSLCTEQSVANLKIPIAPVKVTLLVPILSTTFFLILSSAFIPRRMQRQFSSFVPLHTFLFARGILNPKAP